MRTYILDGHTPIPEPDSKKWSRWFDDYAKSVVAVTEIGDIKVSTVFLGLDHSFSFKPGAPILFETMIFGGPHDGYQTRCATWDEALEMHKAALDLIEDIWRR